MGCLGAFAFLAIFIVVVVWWNWPDVDSRPSCGYQCQLEEDKCGYALGKLHEANDFLITTQAKRNLSSRSGIGGVRSAT